jgi:hypothetical protein
MIHELHPPTILFLAPKSIKLNSAPKNNQPTEEYYLLCFAILGLGLSRREREETEHK